jgi:enamine deaminase RidA (YjgF/YER057c/UK114 family)
MTTLNGISIKKFSGANGGTEYFFIIEAPVTGDFNSQLQALENRYAEALQSVELMPDSAIFRRIFVSDVLNQAPTVERSSLVQETPQHPVAVSIIEQQPLRGEKIALFAYHVTTPSSCIKHRLSPHHLLVKFGGQHHLWSTHLHDNSEESRLSAETQTHGIFDNLIDVLATKQATLLDNCLRTWIYLKDVDVFYHGMVKARNDLFARHHLTKDSHYIASTGIEGACASPNSLVTMDAYSVLDLVPKQVSHLNDFNKLCLAHDYEVAFERATRVDYADRSHYFISGTASIDNAGNVVHLMDVIAQLDRALENVEALLHAGDANLTDMMYLFVYLRDATDYPAVSAHLSKRLPNLPTLIVHGPVCRPEWLIEIEGVATTTQTRADMPLFCN